MGLRHRDLHHSLPLRSATFPPSPTPSFVLPFVPIPPLTVSVTAVVSPRLPVSFSPRLVRVLFPRLIHHVLSPQVVTLSCNYLIFMRLCLSRTGAALVFMHTQGPLASVPLAQSASCHNSSQRETFDWPTGPTALWDLFDFTPLSVVAVILRQRESAWKKR